MSTVLKTGGYVFLTEYRAFAYGDVHLIDKGQGTLILHEAARFYILPEGEKVFATMLEVDFERGMASGKDRILISCNYEIH